MLKNNAAIEEPPTTSVLNPDLLANIRKEDMKQAIYERFSARADVSPRTSVKAAGRSPYWQPVDDEC
jgi:hypothetical protein